MRILFLGRFPPPVHGAATMNENYFNELSKEGDITIKKIKINYSDSLDELGKINLKKFAGFFLVFFQTFFHLLFFRPRVIYFELAPKGFAFYRDSVYVLLCKIFYKKIVFQLQAKGVRDSIKRGKFIKKFYRFIFKNTRVVLLSDLLYFDIKDIVSKEQIEILPNGLKDGLDESSFNKIILERSRNKKLNLLFLSNMIETKGPVDVLNICRSLNKEKINFRCNFVGKFQKKEFEQRFFKLIEDFKLDKKCNYLGAKYGKEKFKVLAKTNYLIFPTKYPEEAFALVIIEAFMYGIPVLSYDNGAIKEIISKDFLGYVSLNGDYNDLFKELLRRIKIKEDHHKIRKEFKDKYQLMFLGKKLKKILERI